MRPLMPLLLTLAAMTASAQDAPLPPPPTALVIHGGAGVMDRAKLSAGDEAAIRAALDRALDAGNAVLMRH
ncbi:MAG: isoaspartyl peptidase/L-asparaginase, partial [Pseudomonadota bacterium]